MASFDWSFLDDLNNRYGLPPGYLKSTLRMESGGDPQAANKSGAAGAFQFMPKTAAQYGLTNPYDPQASATAAGQLAADNAKALKGILGRDVSGNELYLAYNQGATGASRLLQNPDKPAAELVGAKAVVQNGGSPDMTAGQFASTLMSKFDGGAATGDSTTGKSKMDIGDLKPEDYLPQSAGGLGGLGGMGPLLQAIGMSLMSSPHNAPFAGVAGSLATLTKAQQDDLARKLQIAQLKYGIEKDNRTFGLDTKKFALDQENKLADNERQMMVATGPYAAATTARTGLKPKDPGYMDAYKETAKFMQETGGGDYAKTPIWGTDAQGNPTIVQLGSKGEAVQTKLPEGVRVGKDAIKVDAGTHTILLDPVTRQQISVIPKNLAEAASSKEQGQAAGKAASAAPNQIIAADQALTLADQLASHPARESATGWQSNFPTVKGSKVYDFERMLEQAKNGSFLTAVQQMRGLGALSNAEGNKMEATIQRMNLGQSDAGFMQALSEYKDTMKKARARAEAMARAGDPKAMQTLNPAIPGGASPGPIQAGPGWKIIGVE